MNEHDQYPIRCKKVIEGHYYVVEHDIRIDITHVTDAGYDYWLLLSPRNVYEGRTIAREVLQAAGWSFPSFERLLDAKIAAAEYCRSLCVTEVQLQVDAVYSATRAIVDGEHDSGW